jgi:proteasome assembly chaperone (PAC2) family protein
VDGFTVTPVEGLRSPIVIVAFSGWSDTGSVTLDAANHLIDTFDAEPFLEVDPEDYYVFTDTRPTVRVNEEGIREIRWPENRAYYARLPGEPHDLVVLAGVEPNLRWRTFSKHVADVVAGFSPHLVCTLVARPAATPHTRPIPVSGSSADAEVASRYNLGRSTYQGPTGIVGVIHDALRPHKTPLLSLAASVPHYLNVPENPPATLALLKAITGITGLDIPLGDLDEQGEKFMGRVEEASSGDDQIKEYVRSLEEHYGLSDFAPPPDADLPSAADLVQDVEDFLRGQGP